MLPDDTEADRAYWLLRTQIMSWVDGKIETDDARCLREYACTMNEAFATLNDCMERGDTPRWWKR